MSKQTQNSSFKREDKSQLGAEGDAVIIGPTFMQNIHVIPLVFGCTAISLILKLHIWVPTLIEILWCFLHNKYCILTLKQNIRENISPKSHFYILVIRFACSK